MPPAVRDPRAEDLLLLCRIGQRAKVIVDGLAQRPVLAADADATIAAALQSGTADVGAVLESLQTWGWLRQVKAEAGRYGIRGVNRVPATLAPPAGCGG